MIILPDTQCIRQHNLQGKYTLRGFHIYPFQVAHRMMRQISNPRTVLLYSLLDAVARLSKKCDHLILV